MKQFHFFLAFFFLGTFTNYSQNIPSYSWVRTAKCTDIDKMFDVDTDQNGYVYSVGTFYDTTIVGTDTFNLLDPPNWGGMITKWDANGNYQWGIELGKLGYAIDARNIVISDQNEIYVTGRMIGSCTLGSHASAADTTLVSSGNIRSYIAKYNTDGIFQWARLMEGSTSNWIFEIDLDNSNNIVAVGDYNTDINFGNGHNLTAYQQIECFAAWFDPNGTCINHLTYQGHGEERMYDIDFDSQGNYAIGGAFNDTIFIENDTLIANGTGDAFISYYDSNHTLQWYDHFGGSQEIYINSDMVTQVEFDSNDEIFATGIYRDTLFFGQDSLISNGHIDAFLIQYDNSGQKINYNSLGGSQSGDEITGLVLDQNNNVYISVTGNNMTYDDTTYNYYQSLDVHVIKFNSNLDIEWIKRAGGTYSDYSTDLSVTNEGNVYVVGYAGDNNPIEFDSISITPTGQEGNWYESFLAKIGNKESEPTDLDKYQKSESEFILYPNPTAHNFQISGINNDQTILVTNTSGKVIIKENISPNESVNVNYLPKGVYFVLLVEENVLFKLIKR